MKKLIPALCLLLITAVLMGTSTYAWFSMNTQVTATGMTVKATTSKNLLISNSATGTFALSAEVSTSKTSMVPATTSSAAAATNFYKLAAGKASQGYSVSKVNDTATLASDWVTQLTEFGDYVATSTYYVKSESASEGFTKFYLSSATIKKGSETLSSSAVGIEKALRISVTINGVTKIYAPLYDAAQTYTSWDGSTAANVTTTVVGSTADADVCSCTIDSSAQAVVVKVWFEGQDANCTSSLAAAQTDNLTISLTFGAN